MKGTPRHHTKGEIPDVDLFVGRALWEARPKLANEVIPGALDHLQALYLRYEKVLDFEPRGDCSFLTEARQELRNLIGRHIEEILRFGRLVCPGGRGSGEPLTSLTKEPSLAMKTKPPSNGELKELGAAVRAAYVTAKQSCSNLDHIESDYLGVIYPEALYCYEEIVDALRAHAILRECRRGECGRPFHPRKSNQRYCTEDLEGRACGALRRSARSYRKRTERKRAANFPADLEE